MRLPHGAPKVLSDYQDATLNAAAPERHVFAVALDAFEAGREWVWAVVIQNKASFR
ncbi:MAG: hypothetical protein AMXMBFR7_47740 [Planctomycetota bacterium]